MVPGPVLFDWVAGTKVLVRHGETGMTQNLYCGLQDFSDMGYLLHILTPDDLFIDVGANAGSYTVLACGARKARGYSFEPIPSTYRRLMDNIAANNLYTRVTALNIGLSDHDGELLFTCNEDTVNHVIGKNETNHVLTTSVSVRTLDSVLAGESPTMMKIDVEGFEWPVLEGAAATLAKQSLHSIIIELNGSGLRYGFDDNRITQKLADYGFAPYEYFPLSREIRRLSHRNPTGNTLFLRNESELRERISTASVITVLSRRL